MLAGMIGAGVMVAVIVFFSYYKVDTVEVRGTSHYTDEEVKNFSDEKNGRRYFRKRKPGNHKRGKNS